MSTSRESFKQPPQRGPADPALGGVSLVLPVYNESFLIESTLRNYIGELSRRVEDLEVIVAEDGSTDDTKSVLERLEHELPIRLFMSDERKGYLRAVADAVAHATKEWVFVVDSDYQFAAIDFWRLEPYRKNYDVVLGMKSPRKDAWYRTFLSWGQNLILRRTFGVPYRDMDTGFRLVRRGALQEIAPEVKLLSFFTAEFVIRAHCKGYRIVEVGVPHYQRKIGSTQIFFISSLFLICLQQLVAIRKLKKELSASCASGE